ncbi:hypothetical protein H0H92_015982 [Tricholoma furcatifolium]|nr:hypothetical protein H0H92_015982 [Tricholoma furcatifolium]
MPNSATDVNQNIRILLVSALFQFEHSKHSHEEYSSWLGHFIGTDGVQSDIYFFTAPELEPFVSSLRSTGLTVNTTYQTPFAIPPIVPYQDKYREMHAWDRENSYHNPELYAVWNAKPWLLQQGLTNLGGAANYDYAFWIDAGSFRGDHPFRAWPDPARVMEAFLSAQGGGDAGVSGDRFLFPVYSVPGRAEYSWRVEDGPVDADFSEGSFFGSTPAGISWYTKTFYETHNKYINATPPKAQHPHQNLESNSGSGAYPPFHFVGKDQTLINSIIFHNPSRFLGVIAPSRLPLLPPEPKPDAYIYYPYIYTFSSILGRKRIGRWDVCGDWYYYHWWLASSSERERAREAGWEQCGEIGTKMLRIEALLSGLFGTDWVKSRMAGVL